MGGFQDYITAAVYFLLCIGIVSAIFDSNRAAKGVERISKQLDDLRKEQTTSSELAMLKDELATVSRQLAELKGWLKS